MKNYKYVIMVLSIAAFLSAVMFFDLAVRVPEQVIVTGFDQFQKDARFSLFFKDWGVVHFNYKFKERIPIGKGAFDYGFVYKVMATLKAQKDTIRTPLETGELGIKIRKGEESMLLVEILFYKSGDSWSCISLNPKWLDAVKPGISKGRMIV